MTFSYEIANLNEVIKKYVVVKNKVIVYYLDGSSLEMEYTKEIEENLKNLMIKQALERTISSAPHEVVENLRKSFDNFAINLSLGIAALTGSSFANGMELNILLTLIGTILSSMAIMHGINYIINKKRLNELLKYQIYFSIKELLDKNPDLLDQKLNINDIDNYSLLELAKINEDLELANLRKMTQLKNSKKKMLLPCKNV